MKSADKNKEVDTEKGILTLEVDSEVISKRLRTLSLRLMRIIKI